MQKMFQFGTYVGSLNYCFIFEQEHNPVENPIIEDLMVDQMIERVSLVIHDLIYFAKPTIIV